MTAKVLYVQGTSEIGGSDISLCRLIANLSPARCRATVALPRAGPMCRRYEAAGARVVIVPMKQLRPVRSLTYQLGYALGFWPSVFRLVRLIRRERIELVHTNSMYCLYGAFAARIARVPHVWHIREIIDRSPILRFVFRVLVLLLSDRVIPVSEAVARMIQPGAQRAQKICPIFDGIDLTEFNPAISGARIRREQKIETSTPLAGFVARLDPWKGVEIFIRAAHAVAQVRPDVHFIACGGQLKGYEGYAASATTLAASLGLRDVMHFTGWTYQPDDMPEVMAALDMLVHTSLKPEPFGLVLIEAMGTGKPVVAADAGGVPEVVVAGETGLLAAPGDWQSVAEAILKLLNDPAAAAKMGRAGRRRVEQFFEVRAFARKIQDVYDELLD